MLGSSRRELSWRTWAHGHDVGMGGVRADAVILGLAGADRLLAVASLVLLALLSVPRAQVAAGVPQPDNALVQHPAAASALLPPHHVSGAATREMTSAPAAPWHRNKHRGKNRKRAGEQMTERGSRKQQHQQTGGALEGKARQGRGKGTGWGGRGQGRGQGRGPGRGRGAPQIRHQKRRPGRKGVLSSNDTGRPAHVPAPAFRRRPEAKQELVGRRTLEVLASSPLPPHKKAHHHARGRKRDRGQAGTLDPDWLQKLLAAAAVGSARSSAAGAGQSESPCERWLSCSESLRTAIQVQLTALPACPCTFPANVFYYNKIWDRKHGRYYRWRDASGGGERLDIYHPGATHCIRSLHTAAAGILAAQHCCYDRNRMLLTRGSGAGTPALVSPDVSAVLHETLDVRPWRVCKGDFTRYNELRPPNNGNLCAANPDDDEFLRQTKLSQFYR